MLWQPEIPQKYRDATQSDLAQLISQRRQELGGRLMILGHHYQQDEVIQHADFVGDSLKLSQIAAAESPRRGTEFIVFCGVHFMAETADVLTEPSVKVILPDLGAGCSMADMAAYEDAVDAWQYMAAAVKGERVRVIPVTYVNSSAAIKAFVGTNGGACCTSSNAREVFDWALAGGEHPKARGEQIKVFFLPDQHLGRNTAHARGLTTEIDAKKSHKSPQTLVWDPKKDHGGVSPEAIRASDVILWAGHCSVHKLFRPEHVDAIRQRKDDTKVLVHPECCQEVVDASDLVGSTEFIIQTIDRAPSGSSFAVGTEVHLVTRLARAAELRGVSVEMLSGCQCLCTTMYRIDQQHLAWVLDHLVAAKVVNEIRVHEQARAGARIALDRMLTNVATKKLALVD